jgi:hypothetical protein
VNPVGIINHYLGNRDRLRAPIDDLNLHYPELGQADPLDRELFYRRKVLPEYAEGAHAEEQRHQPGE